MPRVGVKKGDKTRSGGKQAKKTTSSNDSKMRIRKRKSGETAASKSSGSKKQKMGTKGKDLVIVMAGSAGGRPPKSLKEMVERLATVIYAPAEGKWKSWAIDGENRKRLKNALNIALKSYPESSIVIASSSFGCRVAAQLWADEGQRLPKAVSRKLICFGYPLFRPKAGQNRKTSLTAIPKEVKLLLVSGNKDDFLNRHYQDLPPGTASLKHLAKDCKAQVTLVSTNGKHNPLDGTKKAERADVEEKVAAFLLS